MRTGSYFYAWDRDLCVIKLTGTLTYSQSGDFDKFIRQLLEKGGFSALLIDLSETESLDSTNLGLIAKLGRYTLEKQDQKSTLVSPKENINRVLKSMGFDEVFRIIDTSSENPALSLSQVSPSGQDEQEIANTILEAHRTLMELNEANREVFKNVVSFLEREIDP